jgi:nucleotide-binding universal stress UspA family protein
MPTSAPEPIVVGADGSDAALDAVAYAACEADIRGVPLRIVHAFVWPLLNVPPVMWQMGPEGGLQAHAELVLANAEKAAHAAASAIQVQTAVSTDFPLPLLVQESRSASLVAVGSPAMGALTDTLVGSIGVQLIAQAHAPVLVVPGTPPPDRGGDLVVVGVDDSPCSAVALAVAAEEAALRHGRLLAVHVVRRRVLATLVSSAGRLGRAGASRFGMVNRASGLGVLDKTLPAIRRRYPDLPIEERILSGHAGGALVDLSTRAAVIVVGARGRGGFAGMVLGSVSQALLHHAQCPVIVVPPQLGEAPRAPLGNDKAAEPTSAAHSEQGGPDEG